MCMRNKEKKSISFIWNFDFACRLRCEAQMINDAMYVVSRGKICVLCGYTLKEYCVINFFTLHNYLL